MSAEIVGQRPMKILAFKNQWENWKNWQNLPRLWILIEGLQHSGECLFKKNSLILMKREDFECFNFSYSNPHLYSFVVALKIPTIPNHSENQQTDSHWNRQNSVGIPSKPHYQRTVITWPVWKTPLTRLSSNWLRAHLVRKALSLGRFIKSI